MSDTDDLIARLRKAANWHYAGTADLLTEAADALTQAATRERQAFEAGADWKRGQWERRPQEFETTAEAYARYQQQGQRRI